MVLINFTDEMLMNVKKRGSSASISKTGLICFNAAAIAKHKIEGYESVSFAYDQEKQLVHLMLSKSLDNKIKLRKREGVIEIGAKHFFNYFKIMPKELMFFEPLLGEQDNILIIDLKKGKTRQQLKQNKSLSTTESWRG